MTDEITTKELLAVVNRLESDFSAYVRGLDTLTMKVDEIKSKIETLIAHSPLTNTRMKDVVNNATAEVVQPIQDSIEKLRKAVS